MIEKWAKKKGRQSQKKKWFSAYGKCPTSVMTLKETKSKKILVFIGKD